jgi:ABC-2 type transport system ATP-binding protein
MDFAVKCEQLSKIFAGRQVVNQINLNVPYGAVYGYLGSNGAGKTTTIRMVINLLKADTGTIEVFGIRLPRNFNTIAPNIGYVPGEIVLYDELSGLELLDYLQNFLKTEVPLRQKLLADFKLSKKDLAKKIRYYSQGMKQKLLLIQAMQHNPELLILDEPSERLDPLMQTVLYEYINEFKKKGKTVFLSSHNLFEVEKICDHIGIIKDGKLLVQEKAQNLREKLPRFVNIFFLQKINPEDFERENITVINSETDKISLKITGPMELLMRLLQNYKVHNLEMPVSALESYFLDYYKTDEF